MIASDDIVVSREEVADDAREPLVVVMPLVAFLDDHGLGNGAPTFQAIGDGHSNVTMLVRRDDAEFILRRPPRGPLAPSAHDVHREARILRAVEGHARVPKVLATCDDESLIGAPFYIMEKVAGHVVTSSVPPTLDTVADRRRMGEELIDALVELHAINWRIVGLEGFGKPTGYSQRQVRRFSGLWERNRTRELPHVEQVGRWLADNVPDAPSATIVHGDFRMGNVMFAPDRPARLTAILDWEMSTIGDPLADLGYLCTHWLDPGDPSLEMFELSGVTREQGFPRRQELITRYEERTGRSSANLRWYQALALWKSAIFMEGNYKRAVAGASNDDWALGFRSGVELLALRAYEAAFGRPS